MIDVIIVSLVVLLVGFAVFKLISDKKKGKTSCGCDCASCKACCANKTEKRQNESDD